MPKGAAARVPVRAPDGELVTVPASELNELPEGAQVLSSEQASAAKRTKEYGGAFDQAAAASFGALRSLTLGASDHAAIAAAKALGGEETGERAREAIRTVGEENPLSEGGGEIAGMLAPALVTGGGSAAVEGGEAASLLGRLGRGATAVPRGVAALGGVAERGAARLVGEGGGLVARALRRGAAVAADAGVQTAAYGGGHEVSEAALGDHELVAEHVMSTMARDFLFGAATGGVLGAGGTFAKAGAAKALGLALGKGGDETLARALRRRADELYYKASGPTQKMQQNAERFFKGGVEGLGATLREEVPEALGGRAARSRADFVEAAPRIKQKGARLIDQALGELDAAAAGKGKHPTAGQVFGQLKDEVLEPLKANTAGAAGENAVRAWAQRAARSLGMLDESAQIIEGAEKRAVTYKELHKLRREVDDLVFTANGMRDTLSAGALREVRSRLERRIEAGAEELAGLANNPEALRGYTKGKQVYAAGREIEKASARGVAQNRSNRFLSLTDNIIGAAGAHLGGIIGSAGGPLGTAAGGALGGALSALANHAIRTRFEFVASDMLARAADLGTLARISDGADHKLVQGVRGFLGARTAATAAARGSEDLFKPKRGESRGQAYQRVATAVATLASSPTEQLDRMRRTMGGTADVAPRTTSALASKFSLGLGYLASMMPQGAFDPYRLQQHLEEPEPPDDEELDTAETLLRTFLDPDTLLEDMKRGEVTPEAVDLVKLTYPRRYARIVETIDRELADPKAPELTWDQEVQLALLFDRPTNELLAPEALADLQGAYASPEAQGPTPPRRASSPGRMRAMQTTAQRTEGE